MRHCALIPRLFRRAIVCGLLLIPEFVFAAIPAGYYDAAQGLQDSLLRQALFDTIRGGVRVHYGTQGYTYPDNVYYSGTWNCFPQTDVRADGRVWDMYSNTARYFPHDGGSGCGLEIEHCLPKSWWGWYDKDTVRSSKRAYQDLYILNPADGQANGQKSNYPPGHVSKGDKFDNESFRMDNAKSSPYGWICFEPAAEYRGDFARTYFYVATAYADLPFGAGKSEYLRYLSNETYLVFKPWLVEVLLDWHRSDPVSRKEIQRAEAVYAVQGNRNPYIDYPDLVEYIWGEKKGERVDFASLICTAEEDYTPAEDFTDFEAFAPSDVSAEGFTAQWSDFRTDYTLDVYTRTSTGHNDTIVSMPAMGTAHIKNAAHVRTRGKVSATAAGTNAITLGVSATDGSIVVYDLGLRAPAMLTFRASIYKTADAGELDIFFNGHTTADSVLVLPINRDETWYSIPLPAGTDSVVITSVGGSTKKRVCMQALYVVQGDLQTTESSLPGYPCDLSENRNWVEVPATLKSNKVYYQVRTLEGTVSNEVCVTLPHSTSIEGTGSQSVNEHPTKVIRGQNVLILRNGEYYDLLGRKVKK